MKDWWRKWSYEMPLALGDALWEVLVVQLAAFLDRLTLRKVIEFVVIAVLVIALVQTFPIDIAILFAGDTLTYLEILIAIRLSAGRDVLVAAFRLVLRLARLAIRALGLAPGHASLRVGRRREQRSRARARKPSRGSDCDADPDLGLVWRAMAPA